MIRLPPLVNGPLTRISTPDDRRNLAVRLPGSPVLLTRKDSFGCGTGEALA